MNILELRKSYKNTYDVIRKEHKAKINAKYKTAYTALAEVCETFEELQEKSEELSVGFLKEYYEYKDDERYIEAIVKRRELDEEMTLIKLKNELDKRVLEIWQLAKGASYANG